jgi:alpha-beta hydrolase superfamily lysophospholipase
MRQRIVKASGLTLAALLLSALAAPGFDLVTTGLAQRSSTPPPSVPPPAPPQAPPPAPMPAPERFTVQSDGHPIAVWARRPAQPRGSILLIHGRTWSSRPDFDLQVPGMQRSVMASLSARGFAAYAVDLRGYGETPRDATGWLTPKRATADVLNVLTWIQRQHPTLPLPAVLGWSRGGAIAMMAAQSQPAKVSAFITFGFVLVAVLQFVDVTLPEKPQMEKNTAESAASDFISPKITPTPVIKAFVEQALKADPILADLKGDSEYNGMKPARVTVPTLVLYGDNDPGVPHEDAGKFFARIAAGDKQMVVLPEADHAAQLEDTHDAWIAAVVNFLTRPKVGK